jgi:hypothetical protein
MTLCIKEQVLGFNVTMRHSLTMKVRHARQDLLKATLDFAWGHAAPFDSCV